MTLRYPSEVGGQAAPDYVEFVPMEYRSNLRGGPQGGAGAGAPAAGGAQAVILYMPNSTPAVGNTNNWGDQKFAGPIGEFTKSVAASAADMTFANGRSISSIQQELTKQFENIKKDTNVGGIARQAALQFVGQQANVQPSQLLALSRGEVYNPNVELLYTSPGMRTFEFSFKFIPKSAAEAQNVNRIIRNFKIWSAPEDIDNGMFKVPHVWQVKYMTGGQENSNMNKFKKAACTSVTVQANPQTTMHVAHSDGMPIETSMSLSFQEVNIITRQDHRDAQGQGF